MKLIKPSWEIWEQTDYTLKGIYKQIEKVGRVCYKSEDKIAEGSADPFVKRMIDNQHYAMLEHGTVYLKKSSSACELCEIHNFKEKYAKNKYSKVRLDVDCNVYVTTNLRVIIENGWESDLILLCEPTQYHEKRICVHFICNRQVSHEFVRHRVFSFAQESTRYCNYHLGKFGNELTFIQPLWTEPVNTENYAELDKEDAPMYIALNRIEQSYMQLINSGWKAQQAATILPNALKTELVMTGFISDWAHFFSLRAKGTTGAPHPQAKELAEPLMNEFINRYGENSITESRFIE